jgi:hypothetical protein
VIGEGQCQISIRLIMKSFVFFLFCAELFDSVTGFLSVSSKKSHPPLL